MKFIGQFIQDFIARFRNDVYLEDLTEAAQDHVVGVDAAGKLYKQDVSSGDMTGVDITVGTGLDISQSNTTGGDYTSTINLDLTEVGVSGSADQLLTDDGDGTVTSESEAKITTQGGLSKFLKNATANNLFSNTSSNAEFNLYEDVVFYDPTNSTKTNRGMFVNLIKGINAHFTSGTLTQIAGQFVTSNPVSTDTGATINQTGLVVQAVGNTTGTSSGIGIDIDVIGSDVNDGVIITTPDTTNGQDIKITSSADEADFFGIKTKASGLTEIITTDSDAANAADLAFDIDGDITFDSVTGNIIGKANGSTYTPSADNHLATKKYVDDNIPDEIVDNGQTFVWKHVHVTADASDCNSMHTTPKELIAAQGSGTTIVLGPGYMHVDKNTSQTQNNAGADLNFHFADLEPGAFGQTSLFHLRRFMNADNADRIYQISPFPALEVGQSLTQGTNKAIEASFDSAITSNSITKIEFYLSYYVITL